MTREEAIKELRGFLGQLTEGCQEAIKVLIPELKEKESEDEKIRKWLFNYVGNCPNENFEFYGGVGKKAVLSWIEKQKSDRMKPIYDARESFESALEKAWNDYHNGYENVDKLEDDYVECAYAKGFREGYLFGIEKQKSAETPQWMIDFLNDILSSCIIYDDYVRRQEYQSKILGTIKWLENQKAKTPQWIIDFLKEIRPYSINKEEYEGYAGRIEFESKILTIIKWLEGNPIQQKEQKKPTLDDPDLYGDWDKDLLEEIHSWLGNLDGKYTPYTIDDIKLTARHFVEWQKQKEQKPVEFFNEYNIIKKHITEDMLSSEVNKRLTECGWYVTEMFNLKPEQKMQKNDNVSAEKKYTAEEVKQIFEDFGRKMLESQEEMPAEFQKIINEYWWEMLDDKELEE